jgi:membrane protease YdiL (CAAX protease family)
VSKRILAYILVPAAILNTIPVCLFGAVFAVTYQRGGNAQSVDLSQPLFWLYVAICIINWGLALFVFWKYKREGKSVRDLMAADGNPFTFNWKPALLMFIAFNAIWILYIVLYAGVTGQWPSYGGLATWQKIVFIGLFPISAGVTEELYWRGFVITQIESDGQTTKRAILFSALGFALVHGVFMPDKLISTFLVGLVAGIYYTRERKLLPLMLIHAFMDFWSYGLSLFVV